MKKIVLGSAALFPFVTFAQNVDSFLDQIGKWMSTLSSLVFAAAVLFFFYGVFKFIMGGGEDKEKGKNIMIWGIVALFVMTSVYGLIQFLGDSLNVNQGGTLDVPSLPGLPSSGSGSGSSGSGMGGGSAIGS